MKTFVLLQAILLLFLAGGCGTSSDVTDKSQKETSIVVKDTTTKGVVVTKFDGRQLSYRRKCESCGFVSPQIIGTSFNKAPWTCKSNFVCPQCGVTTEVVIQRNR